jgi:hydroxymethylpyrimidine pyrophosphatase-like HAD family hydrolase
MLQLILDPTYIGKEKSNMSIIVDIDDTLLRNDNEPIQHVIDYVNSLPGAKIIVTGRNNSQRVETVHALQVSGVKYSKLIMNPEDYKKSHKFKEQIGVDLAPFVTLAIENNPDARKAYEKSGIKTLDPADIPGYTD